jgi:hypothetical protein
MGVGRAAPIFMRRRKPCGTAEREILYFNNSKLFNSKSAPSSNRFEFKSI